MEKLKNMNTFSVIVGCCFICIGALPIYQPDGDDENYMQVLSALQQAKNQGRYLGNVYEQQYDTYDDYPANPATYQDYINELRREQMWEQMGQDRGYYYDQGDEGSIRIDLEVEEEWPREDLKLGQVVGVAVDAESNPHLFHRADRVWDKDHQMFDKDNNFLNEADGPIKEPTVLKLSNEDGTVLSKWGANRFYLPHGLTIDQQGNTWLTDIALHQVFKFEPGKDEPSLTLGDAFKPAENSEDRQRFCKPTDVAVSENGDIFVADGYCNSRVMKFDKSGTFIGQFGEGEFTIPHSISLAEDKDLDLICVADREGMRIMCYNAGINNPDLLGRLEKKYDEPAMGRIFSIEYSPVGGLLYVINGPTGEEKPTGFTIDLRQDSYVTNVLDEWSPENKGFDNPHAVAVSPDGNTVFVGEIGPNRIWKFENIASMEIIADLLADEEQHMFDEQNEGLKENLPSSDDDLEHELEKEENQLVEAKDVKEETINEVKQEQKNDVDHEKDEKTEEQPKVESDNSNTNNNEIKADKSNEEKKKKLNKA